MPYQYISLQEASKLTPYDANYLGLLIRKNRLSAIKKSGKWYTTKELVLQYLGEVAQKSPDYSAAINNPKVSIIANFTLVSTFFIPLMIIVALAAFIFSEGISAEKDVFKISQSEGDVQTVVSSTWKPNSQVEDVFVSTNASYALGTSPSASTHKQ